MNKSKYVENLLSPEKWLIQENGFTKDRTLSYESIFSLSNGYIGTRGALEEGNRYSLLTTFINGVLISLKHLCVNLRICQIG